MREFIARLHLVTLRSFPKPSQWLTPAELHMFERIRAQRRRQDWLAGRWAAKELIRSYFDEEAGLQLTPSQIEIKNDENRAPYLSLTDTGMEERSCISIAHSAGCGLAGLSLHGPIGVDLQQIRAVRPDLAERVLTQHERTQLAHDFAGQESEGFFVFWALKEAARKAQRTRPAAAFHDIAVKLIEPRHAEISLRTQRLKAQWGRWGELIWACAQLLT